MTPTTVTHQTMTHQVDQRMKMVVRMASIQLKVSAMHFTCAPMEFNLKINSVQRVSFSTAKSVIGQLLLTVPKLPPPQPPLLPPLLPPRKNQQPQPAPRSRFQIVIPRSSTSVAR